MKKIAAILFLLSVCVPLLFIVIFKIQQLYIYHEMVEQMETHTLRSIKVPAKNVIWIKQGKEILVDGRMFDIKMFKAENNYYLFTGLFDDEETALMKQYGEKEKSSRENKKISQLFQWMQSVYKDTNELNSSPNCSVKRKFLFENKTSLSSRFISTFTPPPRV